MEKLFVYSEMQVLEDKSINKSIGRTFECGYVSNGSSRKKYSKLINKSELKSMCDKYPDTKIILSTSNLKSIIYTEPSTKYIKG